MFLEIPAYSAVLEYCSAVWLSAADCHLHMLDRVISQASAMCFYDTHCEMWHRRRVAPLYLFYKIPDNDSNPAGSLFPAASRGPIRVTRRELVAHAVLQVCCACLYQGLELL